MLYNLFQLNDGPRCGFRAHAPVRVGL